MSDIRTSRRFPVHLPLKVGEQETPVGTTENMSAAGVYLWLDKQPPVGSIFDFDIMIPGDVIGATEPVGLHCQARVVRCDSEQKEGRSGVACVIEKYEFLRPGTNAEAGGE